MRIRIAIFGLLACMPLAHAQPQRTITLVNQCPFPIYPGATVGNTGVSCTTNADCGAGQFCGGSPTQCYWNPLATSAGTTLDAYSVSIAKNASLSLTIPVLTTGATDTVWSGGIWGGTDVAGAKVRNNATAITGYCAQSNNGAWQVIACPSQVVGPQSAPRTQAEFTLVNSTDTYDITAINGVNVPMEMAPVPTQTPIPTTTGDPNGQYYACGAAGAITDALNKPQSCSWKFAPTNRTIGMALVQHHGMATLCDSNAACTTAGEVCGLAYQSSEGAQGIWQECGVPVSGTWTAVQICTAAAYDEKNLKHVSTALKQALVCGGFHADLFKCTGTNAQSCYNSSGTNTCCGCPSWPAKFKPYGGNPAAADRCYSSNPGWRKVALPFLPYVKAACPTMYSYQYDDVTSTFSCPSVASGINATNYTVTFCPGGRQATVATAK